MRGSRSLRSSHQTKSRPKLAFVCGAENGLFGHFRLFLFSAKNEFAFFYFSFSFQKYHLRWAENVMFATEPWLSSVISAQVTFVFVFFGAEKGISFSSAFFIYGRKWKMHFQSNYVRLHPTSMIFKHSTIQVLDSL